MPFELISVLLLAALAGSAMLARKILDYTPSVTNNSEKEPTKLPQEGSDHLRLLYRIGIVDPNSLEDYKSHGGYKALEKPLKWITKI